MRALTPEEVRTLRVLDAAGPLFRADLEERGALPSADLEAGHGGPLKKSLIDVEHASCWKKRGELDRRSPRTDVIRINDAGRDLLDELGDD